MKLLALDPDLHTIGYAFFDGDNPREVGHVDNGYEGTQRLPLHVSLRYAHQWLKLWRRSLFDWDVLALEIPVFHRNAKTLRELAYLTGALISATDTRIIEVLPSERLLALGLPIRLPRKVAKKAVMNNVKAMFPHLAITTDHESDAVAVGLAALRKMRLEELGLRNDQV